MKKILAMGASNSTQSINKQLATFSISQLEGYDTNLIDLNDFEMPIFSIDKEQATGIPQEAKSFKNLIAESDGIVISFAEHNGSYSSAFKNIFDWTSRIEPSMWLDKPMFLLATSPGPRGGLSVLTLAVNDFPYRKGKVVAQFSLPSFQNNFTPENGISDEGLLKSFKEQLSLFVDNV
ncbi:MAG: chromate reductase [Saprospiraceae bacterium]|jgi:chromate reductase